MRNKLIMLVAAAAELAKIKAAAKEGEAKRYEEMGVEMPESVKGEVKEIEELWEASQEVLGMLMNEKVRGVRL